MRYQKGLNDRYSGGQNGLMPKQSNYTVHTRQYIPPTILAGLLHYAEQQYWDYSTWFQHSDVNINQIQQAHGYVSFTQLCHVIQNALVSSQQPNLGLKIGSSEGLISMGILGFAMQSCKTVADALEIALRYHQVSGSVLNLNFTISEESIELEFIENITPTNLKIFFCDELLSSIMACFNAMLGDHQDIILLELSYSPNTHLAEYQKIVSCPIHFNADRNVIRFKRSMLKRPLKTYSPANYATAIQICERAQQEIDQLNNAQYAYLLEQLIEQHLPVRFDMQLASDYLQMSERHLRRYLLLEGISFQQIRQTVLERKAKQMLENNLSIGDISQALGFSEVREFRRAFKRWTGQAPSVYKNSTE